MIMKTYTLYYMSSLIQIDKLHKFGSYWAKEIKWIFQELLLYTELGATQKHKNKDCTCVFMTCYSSRCYSTYGSIGALALE